MSFSLQGEVEWGIYCVSIYEILECVYSNPAHVVK